MCAGLRQPLDGTLERTAAFTYAPQATSSLQPNLTGYEHARLFEAAYARRAGHLVHAVEGVLQALQFDIRQLRTKVCHLSGGNRQKLNLSLALADERARLLLLDEPYAGFDASSLLAMMALFDQLLSDGKAIVMVNHLVDPRLRIDQSVHLGPTWYLKSVVLVGQVSLMAQARRRTTSLLLVLLPILLFAAMRTSGRSLGVAALGVGLAWSLGVFGAFGVRSNAGLDSRLALGGLRPSRIFVGRLLSFLGVAVVASVPLALAVPLIDSGLEPLTLLVGLTMSATVAVAVGMLVGLLAPGELERTDHHRDLWSPLGLPLDSSALELAPGYGSILYLQYLGDRTDAGYFIHWAAVTVGSLAFAWILWSRSTRRASTLR